MNILLLNQNPVVEKLVTLSAHKLGATVVSVVSTEGLDEGDYDLLIVDEGVYGFEIFGDLAAKISYKKSLYLHARDSEPVDIFNYQIKKPFLPTDLVELLSQITQSIAQSEGQKSDSFEELDHQDDDIFDENTIQSFEDTDIKEIDDSLSSNSFSKEEDFSQDDFANELMDEDEEPQHQILDQEDVQEVQKLLEDEQPTSSDDLDEDHLLISDLDDITLDEGVPDGLEEASEEDEKTQQLLKEELDEIIEHDFADGLHELEDADETVDEKVDEVVEEPIVKEDDTALDVIGTQIEDELSKLDNDTLNTPIDEEMISGLDELSSLDEEMLKTAIEEDEASIQEDEFTFDAAEEPEEVISKEDTDNGSEALTSLLKALQNEDVKASLKGMNIDIHITIGPAK